MKINVWTKLKTILYLLKKHKKKAFSVLVLALLYVFYKKNKMRYLLDRSLEKVQNMVIKELQKNQLQSQQIQQEFQQFKLMNLKYNQNQFRNILNEQFDIEGIRRQLQQKNNSQEQKLKLWSQLRNQTMVYIQMVLIQYSNINFMEYLKDLVPKIVMKMKHDHQISQIHDNFDIQKQSEQIISQLQIRTIEYQKTCSQLTWIRQIDNIKQSQQFNLDQIVDQFQDIQQEYVNLQQIDWNYEQCVINPKQQQSIREQLKQYLQNNWRCLFVQQQIEKNVGVQVANVKCILEMIDEQMKREKDNLNRIIYKVVLDILGSQNYQVYNYKQIGFMNQKLVNRMKYYFIKQNKKDSQMGYVMYLVIIYKIIQEEFLDESSDDNNSNFYQKMIKKNYHLMRDDVEIDDDEDETEMVNRQFELDIIKEFQKYQELNGLKTSIGRKFFLSQKVIDIIDSQMDEKTNGKDKQIRENMDGNSLIDLLNQL